MNKLNTWKLINRSMSEGVAVMLLYVLESHGSSPGRQDFLMTVTEKGEMEGSLGGGIMEYKLVEMAKGQLTAENPGASIHRQIHNKTAARHQSGMICSGEQTILLYQVRITDMDDVCLIIGCYENYRTGVLNISPQGIRFLHAKKPEQESGLHIQSETEWAYKAEIGYKQQLFIIGGGHCALALSRIMHMLDFYIHVYDDRPGLKTMLENESVNEKREVADYGLLSSMIPSGPDNYVVVMTNGYRTDAIVLEALRGKNFNYIGLLGSQSKIDKMFADLKSQGWTDDELKHIHAPVGLPINSHTPEEVAISIAAEIIRKKNVKE